MLIVVICKMEIGLLAITLYLWFNVMEKELERKFKAHYIQRQGCYVLDQHAVLIVVFK